MDDQNNSTTKKSAPLLHNDHPRPVTRREFLAQGLLGFSAFAMAPTLIGLMTSKALSFGRGGMDLDFMPFMVFDMAGGAALPANFLVGKTDGPMDLINSYSKLGWNPRVDAIDSRFGLPMAADKSKILQGILETTSPEAQALFRMGSFCNLSLDDRSTNLLSAVGLIARTGYQGSYMAKGLGTNASISGGNSQAPGALESLAPVQVQGLGDILRSVSFGSAFTDLTPATVEAMARGSLNVSMDQLARLPNNADARLLAELTQSGFEQNIAYAQGATGLDPRADTIFQEVYGINQNTPEVDQGAVAAGITMNVLKGNSGPGVFTLGGCDYHDGTQTTGDGKDLEMGRMIGRAVQSAHRLQKPFFFQLLTDGGCFSGDNNRNWTGDAAEKSMTVIGQYNPTGARSYRRLQVGRYTNGQGADTGTLIGNDPAKVAYAVFANYLNAIGAVGEFETLAPGIFTNAELESVLIFE